MKIILLGFMGSGKSSIGKKVAARLNLPFIDLDDLIVWKEMKTIPTIFKEQGEDHFRALEQKMLAEVLAKEDGFLLSCGGGTPCHNENMTLINKYGISIYLDADAPYLYERLRPKTATRPLIAGMKDQELLNFIENKLIERLPFYRKAAHAIQYSSKEDGIEKIATLLQDKSQA